MSEVQHRYVASTNVWNRVCMQMIPDSVRFCGIEGYKLPDINTEVCMVATDFMPAAAASSSCSVAHDDNWLLCSCALLQTNVACSHEIRCMTGTGYSAEL